MINNLIQSGSNVLVAPLNWGLGHATRSIPIIRFLLEHKCNVTIASDGSPLELLKKEFPDLKTLSLPSYGINYRYSSMALNMFVQLPKIFTAYANEQREIERLQKTHKWDVIISDGRFGVRSSSSKNIIISHQLQIQSWNPLAKTLANKVNHFLLNKFDQVWVPDSKDHLLSGNLSITNGLKNVKFIGAISRLVHQRLPIKYDLAVILSGPEPSRNKLENQLWKLLSQSGKKIIWVRGVNDLDVLTHENIEVLNRITSPQMNQVLNSAKLILCRSGYSSIMDLHQLDKKAILIPTPGQTEQEYLAKWLNGNKQFSFISENQLSDILTLI